MLRHNGSPEIRRCPLRLFEATLGEQFDTLGTTLFFKAFLKGIPSHCSSLQRGLLILLSAVGRIAFSTGIALALRMTWKLAQSFSKISAASVESRSRLVTSKM